MSRMVQFEALHGLLVDRLNAQFLGFDAVRRQVLEAALTLL